MWGFARRHLAIWKESLAADREARKGAIGLENEEFLPAALEIVERPPNPLGRIVLWLLLSFIVLAVVWSILGQVDTVATARGKVEPRGRVKIIQASDLGVVRSIHVADGQSVAAGQILIELNPTVSGAEVEQARQSFRAAQVDVARASALQAYLDGRSARFISPAGLRPPEVALQQNLIDARIRQFETASAGLGHDHGQRRSDVAMVSAEIRKLEEQLPLATQQLASLEQLQSQGYAPRLRVDEVRERVVGMRQDLAIRREERVRAVSGQMSAGEDVNKLRSEFAREVYDALTEASANSQLREQELRKADEKARLTVIRAPEAGVVQQLQANTIGGVVEPAAPLMVLVPQAGDLVLQVRILNRDIGFVREGQRVEIKLEAYPFTRFGVLDGVVEHIGKDAIDDETEGLVFPARIRLLQTPAASSISVAPGMAVTAEIKTGRRRIIEFLLSPLQRRAAEAGRER